MLFPTLIVLCASTYAVHTSRVVKRDLYQTLQLASSSGYPFQSRPLKFLVHPTEQSPTVYGPYFGLNKFDKTGGSPSHHYGPSFPDIHSSSGFHPDFSIHNRPFEPSGHLHGNDLPHTKDNGHDNHKREGYLGGGVPDFHYVTTGGVSGPQPEFNYISHHALSIPLETFSVPDDHRLKQGYSPVHYRYNDDDDSPIKCNKYHCPL